MYIYIQNHTQDYVHIYSESDPGLCKHKFHISSISTFQFLFIMSVLVPMEEQQSLGDGDRINIC